MNIFHLILANEDSDEVNFYNKYTYDFIEKLYNSITGTKKFDILKQIKKDLKNIVPTMLSNNINIKFNNRKDMLKNKIIRLELKEEITYKKCVIDELGFSFFKTGNFEPKYNYFISKDNILELRFEIPGNAKCGSKCYIEKENTIINIFGKKNKDKVPENLKDNIVNIREFSDFEVSIPLPTEKYQIVGNKPIGKPEHKNGIWLFKYELAKQGESCGDEINEI